MSNYSGRHGPNVSQYLRDLNTISPQAETIEDSSLNFEEDLTIFTNTQFFDFDSGQNTDFQAQPAKPEGKAPHSGTTSEDVSAAPSVIGEMPNLDFMSGKFTILAIFLHFYAYAHVFFFPLQFLSLFSYFPLIDFSFLGRNETLAFSISSRTHARS